MDSIRLRLLRWLVLPVLLLNLAGMALSYALAWIPAQIAFDQSLGDAAAMLAARTSEREGRLVLDLPPAAERALRNDELDKVYFSLRDSGGRLLAGDAALPMPAAGAARGASPASDGEVAGEAVRLVAQPVQAGQQAGLLVVAKTLRKRGQARAAIVRAMLPLAAVLTLASAGLVWFSVTSGLAPLHKVRAGIQARGADDTAPIALAEVPLEVAPLVQAFNGLLEKVHDGAQAQQDFLANVAHQLRTPLAGMRTQIDLLAAQPRAPEAAAALGMMQASTDRMIRQVNQLLAFARAEPGPLRKTRMERLALDQLLEESIQHFVEQALRKEIDLGFDLQPTMVKGDRFLLRDLVDNLVDNAIRYTPPGGTVTVSCFAHLGGGMLTVEDSGPGIAPAKRAAVFQRFQRLDEKTTGSGLGLAIVRDIATAHGASVAIDTPPGGQGALFSVYFPA
ncbi:sensor histidine kinase [Pseudoduganella sp. DS3]|uniref:histidine kinase n=1 Tax=Pseudoduganella guangdongensis TaxID=2692179 RepID=A0A6N9HQ16_9BURK|nr:sensor histidine kinase [Pseudoduganella guangdongensis]MYN04902.1 sensor histidine kinase [Pseudoduganella guangdongensis]